MLFTLDRHVRSCLVLDLMSNALQTFNRMVTGLFHFYLWESQTSLSVKEPDEQDSSHWLADTVQVCMYGS